jgi:hypothetical protein
MQGRTEVAGHVAEGMSAYALEQSEAEERRALRWATQWSAIRGRAQSILKTQASDSDDDDSWPDLVVDLPDEEDQYQEEYEEEEEEEEEDV